MATFQDRVEDYVGTFSDTAALTVWLTESARKLVDLIPLEKAMRWGKETLFTGITGTSLHDSRILGVFIANREARRVPAGIKADMADEDSIHYATARDPICWVYAGKVFAYPCTSVEEGNPAALHSLSYPTSVQWDDSTIPDFPVELEEPVVLDVASKAQLQLIRVQIASMSVSAFSLTDPLLSLTMNDAAVIDLSTQQSAINTLFSSIDTAIGVVTGYIDTNKDIELAEEKLREIDRFLGSISARVADIGERLSEFRAEGEEELATYNARLSGWKVERDAVVAKFMADLQQETARIQSLAGKVTQMSSNFVMLRKMYNDSLRVLLGIGVEEKTQVQQ